MLTILVTGASGAIGPATIRSLCQRHPSARIIALGRSFEHMPEGVTQALRYDLRLPFSEQATDHLRAAFAEADWAIHMGANVRWEAEPAHAEAVNAAGTKQFVMALERRAPRLKRFAHVSTAFAQPPARHSSFVPLLTREGIAFANVYEYTKWLAEQCVVQSSLPWTIVRPSLIVGSAVDGSIGRYHGIYRLYRPAARNLLPMLPGFPDALIDIIPVDFFAYALATTLDDPATLHRIITLVSGEDSLNAHEIVETSSRVINAFRAAHGRPRIETPKIVPPERYQRFFEPFIRTTLRANVRSIIERLSPFQAYFCILQPFEVLDYRPPSPRTYFDRIVGTWCEANLTAALADPFNWENAVVDGI